MKKQEKARKEIINPRSEAFLPMIFSAVCMFIALAVSLIDRFVYNMGSDLLSPMLSQIIILLIPSYLFIMATMPRTSILSQARDLGIKKLKAGYIFLTVFAAVFIIPTSFLINIIFGGVHTCAEGFTLFGTFTAGVNEYTVSYQYLIPVYAIAPAVIEELVFRGIIYSSFKKISVPMAYMMSSLISALFVFSPAAMPSAFFCSVVYCYILQTTGSLLSCMITHFIFNMYGLFVEVNLSQYYLASGNNSLLLITVFLVWLVGCVLFFGESARIYRSFSQKIKESNEESSLPPMDMHKLKTEFLSILKHRPTLISALCCVILCAASVLISVFF